MLRGVPDQLRIRAIAPNERVPPARLDFQKNWSARVIRKNLQPQFQGKLVTSIW